MPKYIYTAKDETGKTKGGMTEAKNESALAQQLKAEGFLVTSIKPATEEATVSKIKFLDRFKRVSLKEKMVFARNLGVMVASGVPLVRSIENLSVQATSEIFKKILFEVREDVQGGKSLSSALAKYPAVFNELFVNMVKVGEAGGNLEEVLNIVAEQLEKEHELLAKVRGAMIYPAVIMVAMVGVAILMLTYILPKITNVFENMDIDLPASTQFIIGLSDFLKNHSLASILIIIFGGVAFRFFSKTAVGKKIISFIAIYSPLISTLVIKVNCARFSRIYSSLLKSGVSAVESLKIVANTLTNYYYNKALNEGVEHIQKGVELSKIIRKQKRVFPVIVPQMIEVGEETGKIEEVLLKLAEFYEAEVNRLTKNLSSIIEPIIMLVIGGAVGFFAVSMLQPMYGILENIH